MSKNLLLAVAILLVGGAVFFFANTPKDASGTPAEPRPAITVYKSPTCGCCGNYATYLKRQGFDVAVVDTRNMGEIKQKYGIPSALESCHTSVIGDYVVEGHIPVEAINKLLGEKPAIAGIALAGMPSGSPGMPGPKSGPFQIHSLSEPGKDGGIYWPF